MLKCIERYVAGVNGANVVCGYKLYSTKNNRTVLISKSKLVELKMGDGGLDYNSSIPSQPVAVHKNKFVIEYEKIGVDLTILDKPYKKYSQDGKVVAFSGGLYNKSSVKIFDLQKDLDAVFAGESKEVYYG